MNQVTYLQLLCNKYGDFKIAFGSKQGWSKHLSVMECWERGDWQFMQRANNRQIFNNELVLDIDEKTQSESLNKVKQIIPELDNAELEYKIFFTGSRGYHIHILFDTNLNSMEKFKMDIIRVLGTDMMKAHSNTMIALEHAPHWKTGIEKKEVDKNGEFRGTIRDIEE